MLEPVAVSWKIPMDLQDRGRQILSPLEQASFLPLILQVNNEGHEYGMAPDSKHGLSEHGHTDCPRVQSVRASSTCNRSLFRSRREGYTGRRESDDGTNILNQFVKADGDYPATDFKAPT